MEGLFGRLELGNGNGLITINESEFWREELHAQRYSPESRANNRKINDNSLVFNIALDDMILTKFSQIIYHPDMFRPTLESPVTVFFKIDESPL